MESTELLWICVSAFVAVGVLLSVLSAIMRLILVVFPVREKGTDAMMIAAVASVLQTVYPGTKITKVEEIQ